MSVFSYKAVDINGREKSGVVDGESVKAARLKLKVQGLFPVDLKEIDEKQDAKKGFLNLKPRGKVKLDELSVATRQLATLIGAGMPVIDSLKALIEQLDNRYFKSVVSEVTEQVNQGSSLANSLKSQGDVFPRLYINMVAAGEASGSLDVVLNRLADLLESQTALRRKLMSALTYPALMISLCVVVVIVLLTYVVPQISKIFQDRGAILPLPTRIIIGLSNFLKDNSILLVGLSIVSVIFWKKFLKTSLGKRLKDKTLLALPVISNLTLKAATSRFSRNLGSMLESGIEMLGALTISKATLENSILEESINKVIDGVREGRSLSSEIQMTGKFPRLLPKMISIGEKTGQLELMLIKSAQNFENEVQAIVSSLTSIIEPVLILFLALVVGGILASVMLPMLEMSQLSGLSK